MRNGTLWGPHVPTHWGCRCRPTMTGQRCHCASTWPSCCAHASPTTSASVASTLPALVHPIVTMVRLDRDHVGVGLLSLQHTLHTHVSTHSHIHTTHTHTHTLHTHDPHTTHTHIHTYTYTHTYSHMHYTVMYVPDGGATPGGSGGSPARAADCS